MTDPSFNERLLKITEAMSKNTRVKITLVPAPDEGWLGHLKARALSTIYTFHLFSLCLPLYKPPRFQPTI